MPVHTSTKSFHIMYLNINIYTVYTHTLFPRCCLPLALQPNIWMSDWCHPGYLVDGLNGPGRGRPCWIGNSNYRWRQKLTGSLGELAEIECSEASRLMDAGNRQFPRLSSQTKRFFRFFISGKIFGGIFGDFGQTFWMWVNDSSFKS